MNKKVKEIFNIFLLNHFHNDIKNSPQTMEEKLTELLDFIYMKGFLDGEENASKNKEVVV